MDHYMLKDIKYLQFKSFLNIKCLVYPTVFMTMHNLFNLHYVFYDQNCDQSSFERIVSTVYKQAFWNLKDFPETIEIWRLGNFGPIWERIR